MKNFLIRILPATALSAVLMASGAMAADKGDDFDPKRMLERMSKHLDLSEEQETQIESILLEDAEQMKADRARMGEIREALHEQQSDFDEKKARALADEMGEISARMAYERASDRASVYQVLNDDQRAQLASMREKRDERRGEKRGKGKLRDRE